MLQLGDDPSLFAVVVAPEVLDLLPKGPAPARGPEVGQLPLNESLRIVQLQVFPVLQLLFLPVSPVGQVLEEG